MCFIGDIGRRSSGQGKLEKNLVERPKEGPADEFAVEVGAQNVLLLSFLDERLKNLEVIGEFGIFIFFDEFSALSKFDGDKFGQIAIFHSEVKVHVDEGPQFIEHSSVDGFQFTVETIDDPFHSVFKKRDEKIVFILKIEIDRSVGDPGFAGDFGDPGIIKAFFGKGFQRALKDALSFLRSVALSVGLGHRTFHPVIAILAVDREVNE